MNIKCNYNVSEHEVHNLMDFYQYNQTEKPLFDVQLYRLKHVVVMVPIISMARP